jgi:hypothetical protein
MPMLQNPFSGLNPPINTFSATPEMSVRTPQQETGIKFEQMMWAQMLRHSGLEDAFTKSGGEAVSAFSQFIVEAIAKDLAEKHPLGLSSKAVSASDGTGNAPIQPSMGANPYA